jgi:hypothetical protein
MARECACKEFKENLPKVNAPIFLFNARNPGRGYDGVPFRYCPWCSALLIESSTADAGAKL